MIGWIAFGLLAAAVVGVVIWAVVYVFKHPVIR